MDRETLDSYIEDAPNEPGVYLFYDGERVLYVGKAIDIRDRLTSYRDPRTPRIARMRERADSIETRTTEDGRKALLLEANLIKQYQPKYNTRLKDGKSYPVIELTDHQFPQIRASRDPDAASMVFGPFTSMQRVETAIKAFRDLYGLRNCSDHTLETRDRPCVAYQMGLCSAPCAGLISEEEYADRVETVRSFFRDDPAPILDKITEKMEEAAQEKQYERAATLRDYRDALTDLLEGREDRDTGEIHAVAVGPDRNRIGLASVEDDRITDKTVHRLAGQPNDDQAAIATFLEQYYARHPLPDRIVVTKQPADTLIEDWLQAEDTSLQEPANGRDRVLVDTARSATGDRQETIDFGDRFETEIERIECFDISHTGGDAVMGSNVVFVHGEPVTGDYRRKILDQQNDDYANMATLLKWRVQRHEAGRDERPKPDLIVIDGGQGQLKAARRTIRYFDWDVPILAIAKPDDRILAPGGDVLDLPDAAWQVLREARDEAHRFAKQSHTKRRDAVDSKLEEIDGIGPELRKTILDQYSLDELSDLGMEELTSIDGIGEKRATQINDTIDEWTSS
ncbi:MAG: excinuclease ABC subunit C [Candidatus Nanohaloarchaeota archaeon QJJ-5]|nr:excinuclease ABC subunit C [Candidatus Nanohaloarchaeota archaeon QJJ-5]